MLSVSGQAAGHTSGVGSWDRWMPSSRICAGLRMLSVLLFTQAALAVRFASWAPVTHSAAWLWT